MLVWKCSVSCVQAVTCVGVVEVTVDALVDALKPEPDRCTAAIHALIPKLASARYSEWMAEVTAASAVLAKQPETVSEMADRVQYIARCEKMRPELDAMFEVVEEHYRLCEVSIRPALAVVSEARAACGCCAVRSVACRSLK